MTIRNHTHLSLIISQAGLFHHPHRNIMTRSEAKPPRVPDMTTIIPPYLCGGDTFPRLALQEKHYLQIDKSLNSQIWSAFPLESTANMAWCNPINSWEAENEMHQKCKS